MAMISRFHAVAKVGRLQLTGLLAWLLWLLIHLVYIVGFKSRLATAMSWTWSFLGRTRGHLAVTEQQVVARTAINRLDAWEDSRAVPEAATASAR